MVMNNFGKLFKFKVNLTKHQSLTKTETISQRWSTIGALCSSIGAWIAFGSMFYHQSDIETRIAEIKTKRALLIQQRNEAKLKENLNDIVNTVQSEENYWITKLQPLLIPAFSGLTLFLGFYIVGRRQSFKKHLSDLIKEKHRQNPDDPVIASLVSTTRKNSSPNYKPLSEIKVK